MARSTRDEAETAEAAIPPPKASPKRHRLGKPKEPFTVDELCNPTSVRMLQKEIGRLEQEVDSLKELGERFHDSDKRVAVFSAKTRVTLAGELVCGTCFLLAGAFLGHAPSMGRGNGLVYIAGAILVLVGVAARVVMR
jgi:hypothetical protein